MTPTTEIGSVQAAVWTTAYVDSLPNSSFAYVSDDGKTRKLPYKDKDGKVDLPHVRNALARLNQTKDIPDSEKAKIRTRLQNALKSAKADGLDSNSFSLSQTHSLQADSTTGAEQLPNRLMLLRSGQFDPPKYWPFEITADDLHEMKDNFELGIGLPGDGSKGMPIDFGHKAGEKAAGWVKRLEVEADDEGNAVLWGHDVKWSTSGKAAVLGDEYAFLSSDFWPRDWPSEWQSSEQAGLTAHNVIRGVALTNVPMFEGNDGIMASDIPNERTQPEPGHTGVDFVYVQASEIIKEKRMNLDALRVKASEELTGPEALFVAAHASDLSADERKKFGLEAAAPETTTTATNPAPAQPEQPVTVAPVSASSVTGTEGVVSVQAADLKAIQDTNKAQAEALKAAQDGIAALQASIAKLEENNTTLQASQKAEEEAKMKAIAEEAAARGAIKADRVESYTKRLLAAQGADREELIADLKALSSNPLLAHTYGSSQSEGTAAMDAEAEIMKKANELVRASANTDQKMNIFQARKQVLASDPELSARAGGSVMASAGGFDPFRGNMSWSSESLPTVNREVSKK